MKRCAVSKCDRMGLRWEERRTTAGERVGPLCQPHAEAIDETPERFVVLFGMLIELPS